MAHQTHNKSGNHGIKSPLRVSVITNQCVSCGSTFVDRPTAQNHVVNSWTNGTCRTDRSHMTWALEDITLPISCNLCAQEFGDLQTYYTHVRLTHLPFPSADDTRTHTCPACSTTQMPQAALKRWTRAQAEDPPRGTAAEAEEEQPRRQLRRTVSRAKREGEDRGPTAAETKPPKKETKFDQKSLNKLMLKAMLKMHQTTRELTSTVWVTLLVKASSPRSRQHAEADANLRGKGATRGSMTHSRTTFRMGVSGPGQVHSAERHNSGSTNGTGNSELLGPT